MPGPPTWAIQFGPACLPVAVADRALVELKLVRYPRKLTIEASCQLLCRFLSLDSMLWALVVCFWGGGGGSAQ